MPETTNDAGGQERDATTHFGFEEVPRDQKTGMVRDLFQTVASRYDLMNDLMSGGIHRLWKATMVDLLAPRPAFIGDWRLLDVAGGTGDIAFRVLDRVGEAGSVVVCDLTEDMLSVGRDRAIDRGWQAAEADSRLIWLCGDAQALPLRDRSVDAYSIAFGLRNVTDIDLALREARRVLRPGGRFVCLEFSKVSLPLFAELYDLYSFRVLPAMGALVAGDRDAYRYLAESIRRFPAQDELAERITASGLAQARYRNLSGGIAALHSAWRI